MLQVWITTRPRLMTEQKQQDSVTNAHNYSGTDNFQLEDGIFGLTWPR